MQCFVQEIDVDHTDHVAYVQLDAVGACDMVGCLTTVQELDPEVIEINVFSGEKPDVRYTRRDGPWTAFRLVRREPAPADVA
jgi:hypothetical protein